MRGSKRGEGEDGARQGRVRGSQSVRRGWRVSICVTLGALEEGLECKTDQKEGPGQSFGRPGCGGRLALLGMFISCIPTLTLITISPSCTAPGWVDGSGRSTAGQAAVSQNVSCCERAPWSGGWVWF